MKHNTISQHTHDVNTNSNEILPIEILTLIFSYLDLKDFSVIEKVCKSWFFAAKNTLGLNEIDYKFAEHWLTKIKMEINKSPPQFNSNRRVQYQRFYFKANAIRSAVKNYNSLFKRESFEKTLISCSITQSVKSLKDLIQFNPKLTKKVYSTELITTLLALAITDKSLPLFIVHFNNFLSAAGFEKNYYLSRIPSSLYFQNPDQDSLLHMAVRAKNAQMVSLLLNSDARIYTKNLKGETPLSLAYEDGQAFDLFKEYIKTQDLKNFTNDQFFEKYRVPKAAVVANEEVDNSNSPSYRKI